MKSSFAMAAFCATGAWMAMTGCKNSDQPTGQAREASRVVHDAGCPHQDGGSCGPAPTSPQAQKPSAPEGSSTTMAFGAPLTLTNQVPLENILNDPDKYHEEKVRVSGLVRRACSKKGCWMEISPSNDETASGCRVTFKDYGFLVPTDSAGSFAELDAEVQVTQVEARAVAHYEAEGARFAAKAPDGSAREVRLVATGVRLTRTPEKSDRKL